MDELVKLLGNELYSQVKSKIGERGLIIDTGMLIPKHRFDCVNISLKEHKQTVISQKQRIAELERIAEELYRDAERSLNPPQPKPKLLPSANIEQTKNAAL